MRLLPVVRMAGERVSHFCGLGNLNFEASACFVHAMQNVRLLPVVRMASERVSHFCGHCHRHRAVDGRSCTGHLLGVPVLPRVLHVLPKYCTIAIDTGPSTIELALDISSGSRYCLVYYTYYLSTAPLPSTQGRRRSNLHWTSPRGPGTVSCTTRTT